MIPEHPAPDPRRRRFFAREAVAHLSRDGNLAAVADKGGLVRLFDTRTGALLARAEPDEESHGSVTPVLLLSPDGSRVATVDHHYIFRLFDVRSGAMIVRVEIVDPDTDVMAFADGGTRLLVGMFGHPVVLDAVSGMELDVPPDALVLDPALCACGSLRMKVVDTSVHVRRDAWSEATVVPFGEPVHSPVMSSNSRYIAAVTTSEAVLVAEMGGGIVASSPPHPTVDLLTVSPDGARLIHGSRRQVFVTGVATGEGFFELTSKGLIRSVTYSADGSALLVVAQDLPPMVHDAATGALRSMLDNRDCR